MFRIAFGCIFNLYHGRPLAIVFVHPVFKKQQLRKVGKMSEIRPEMGKCQFYTPHMATLSGSEFA